MAKLQLTAPVVINPYVALTFGLLAASTGLIFVRMTQSEGMTTLALIVIRFGIATLALTPLVLHKYRPAIQKMQRRDWLMLLAAAFFFAGDIFSFSEAVNHTSILLAAVIGGLLPLWTALFERLFLKTPIHRMVYVGMSLAIIGGIVITVAGSSGDANMGENPLLGGLLALTSGISAAAYLTLARVLRQRFELVPYIWLVFGIAGLIALVATVVTGTSITGHTLNGYLWALVVVLVNQLGAQTAFNIAIAHLSPTFISIAAQSITVIVAVLAILFFQEIPVLGEIIGSAIILVGVIFAIRGQSRLNPS